jgi:alcohol dehydrogenase class IV
VKDANPATSLMAEESIRALGVALPRFLNDQNDADAWTEALYGSWLAGVCLGSVSMAVHHKICRTIGGAFDLSHADVHRVMLPYTAAFTSRETRIRGYSKNAQSVPGMIERRLAQGQQLDEDPSRKIAGIQ